ncbi:MAG: hypothetical protein H7Z42_08625 [Roseiflexaceae bacterium]|nr:hypothetical protein [Roseiflexaceae bacterium]
MHTTQPRTTREFFFFQRLVGWALLVWGVSNIGLGVASLFGRQPFLRQFGLQALSWGAINAVIAVFGLRGALKSLAQGDDPAASGGRFRVVVAVNALLDLGYLAGGTAALRSARGKPGRAGTGVGIIVQGLFLLIFDLVLVALSGKYTRPANR